MNDRDFYCYEFGEFRLDVRRRSLFKDGGRVPVSARNFDLLQFLVENSGRVLEHNELLDKVWVGTFVEQATLKKGVSALRQILDESPESEFIKTIPRRGYSFVFPVRRVPEKNEAVIVRETDQEVVVEEFEETDEADPGPAALAHRATFALDRKWLWRFTLAAVGLAAMVLIFIGVRNYFAKDDVSRFNAENVRITRLTNNGRVTTGTTVSPDGNYVLYPTSEPDGEVLWLRQVLADSASKLTVPKKGNFYAFGFAPDNSYVYYIFHGAAGSDKSSLFKVPFLGGEPELLLENVSSFAVSPDGQRLAVVRITESDLIGTTTIFTTNTKGEDQRNVKTFPTGYRLWNISWSPGGESLLGAVRKTEGGKMVFFVAEISLADGAERMVLPAQDRVIYSAVWLPDRSGLLLVVREPNADLRQIWRYDLAAQIWRRITNDNLSYQNISLTRDGSMIGAMQESRLAGIWVAEGTWPSIKRDSFRPLNDTIGRLDRIDWFADGKLMYDTVEDKQEKIFTLMADGTNPRPVTAGDDGMWLEANVAGDGQDVTFLSNRSGLRQLWRVDGNGKNLVQVTDLKEPVIYARILRDNATVVYVADESGPVHLLWETRNGQTRPLTESNTGAWAISPNEKLVAAVTKDNQTGDFRIELRSLEDGKSIKTFPLRSAAQMKFLPDGMNLAYIAVIDGVGQIMIQPLDGGEPFVMTDFSTDSIFSFAWSADGKRFAVIRGKQLQDVVMIKADGGK